MEKGRIFCSRCKKAITAGDEYRHDSNVLCESCYIDIRTPLKRKTHWQYIGSIKGDYLIPGKSD